MTAAATPRERMVDRQQRMRSVRHRARARQDQLKRERRDAKGAYERECVGLVTGEGSEDRVELIERELSRVDAELRRVAAALAYLRG